ncbi:enoyl-CoA hydratase/isomerase family protein [Micromonospora sonneratiae]|uniref:Enoyl-CoA hydratase/isomerase family protein n=1 Tax=Micromonospora sonneratiae TaxID=1184706 RepID=A0ABW3Y6S6_9ACTN
MGTSVPTAQPADWTAGHVGDRIRTTRAGGVLDVVLDHGPVNALDLEAYRELAQCFVEVGRDPGLEVVTLTGAGRHFCAGQDRADTGRLTADPAGYLGQAGQAVEAVLTCPLPVVCGVAGAAVGTGLILATSADVLIVADDGILSLPEARFGVVAGYAHLAQQAGPGLARFAVLTGRPIPARLLEPAGVQVVDRAGIGSAVAAAVSEILMAPAGIARQVKAGWLTDRRRLAGEYLAELERTLAADAIGFV